MRTNITKFNNIKIEQDMQKAILYTRVSTEDQAKHGFSLENQIKALNRYCDSNGIIPVCHFEEDYSGKNFNRPKWIELRNYLRQHKKQIDVVLFTRWDRLSRNLSETFNVLAEFKLLGIELKSIEQEGYNAENPESMYGLAVTLASAQVERERISIRTRASYKVAKESGRYLGKVPMGYVYAKDESKKAILQIDDLNAPFIKACFELYAKGNHSIPEVQRIVCSIQNRKPISKQAFINILSNRVYVGDIVIPASKEKQKTYINGIHEPIVTREVFDEVQWILGGRKRQKNIRRPNDERLILRRFLLCPECGKNMTGCANKQRKHPYYQCQKGHHRFNAHIVNQKFIEIITKDFCCSNELIKIYKSILEDTYYQNRIQITSQIESLDIRINKCQNEKEEKLTNYLDGRIAPEVYNECLKRLGKVENELVTERTRLSIELKSDFKKYVSESIPIISNLAHYYTNGDTDIKVRILNSILDGKMVFFNGKYQTLKYNPAIELLLNVDKGLREKEKEQNSKSAPWSSKAPQSGLEPETL